MSYEGYRTAHNYFNPKFALVLNLTVQFSEPKFSYVVLGPKPNHTVTAAPEEKSGDHKNDDNTP